MQLRRKPFGEWILVYFDKSKISEKTLLQLTKTRGCKRAAVIRGKEVKAGSTSGQVINPYLCAGDSIAVEINSNGKEQLELETPQGWTFKMPEKVNGKVTVFINIPAGSKEGAYTIKLKSGSESADMKCHLVKKIGK